MLKTIKLFITTEEANFVIKKGEIGSKELNLKEIHEKLEKENSEIVFNLNKETELKFKCKHVSRNRRDKIVWYGEAKDHSFAMIVVNHIDNKDYSFYGEIVKEDTQYLINSTSQNNQVLIVKNKRTAEHRCGTCDATNKHNTELKSTKSIIEEDTANKATLTASTQPNWEPFDPSIIKEETAELKVLVVYNKKTKEEVERISKGKAFVGGKQTGKEIIEYLTHIAEDTTNTIFKNSKVNAKVHLIIHEIEIDLLLSLKEGKPSTYYTHDNFEKADNINNPALKPLYELKSKEKAHVVCVFIPTSVDVDGATTLVSLVDDSTVANNKMFRHFIVMALLFDRQDSGNYQLDNSIFPHEFGHALGGAHTPAVDAGNKPYILLPGREQDFMRGYTFNAYPRQETMLGYTNAIMYYSSPELTYNGQKLGIPVGHLGETDMVRGLKATTKFYARKYNNIKVIPLTMKIEPNNDSLPILGRITREPISTTKMKLTAIPFENRSTFRQWLIGSERVRNQNPIVINTTTVSEVTAVFNHEDKHFTVDFEKSNLINSYNVYYEKNTEIVNTKLSGNNLSLSVYAGTDIDLHKVPDIGPLDEQNMFVRYLLDGKELKEKAFRVTKNCKVSANILQRDQLLFYIERADLGNVRLGYSFDIIGYIARVYDEKNAIFDKWLLNDVAYSNKDILLLSDILDYMNSHNIKSIKIKAVFKEENHTDTHTLCKISFKITPEKIGRIFPSPVQNDISYYNSKRMMLNILEVTVKKDSKFQANIVFSGSEKNHGYVVKSWSNNSSTTNSALYIADKDMTITAHVEIKK